MQMEPSYRNLLSGTEMLESQLRETFPEYLNAEIVLRNVVDPAWRHCMAQEHLSVRPGKLHTYHDPCGFACHPSE